MSHVFERAARITGDAIFGFRVGMSMRPEDYGAFVDYALAAPDLDQMTRRVSGLSLLQTNAVRLVAEPVGEDVVWRLSYVAGPSLVRDQHALHILPTMVGAIRQFLGPAFLRRHRDERRGKGEGLRLEAALDDRATLAALEESLGLPVRGGMDRYGVVFPASWLRAGPGQPRPASLTFCQVYNRYFPRLPRTAAEAVGLMLEPRLAQGGVQLDDVARQLGVSRRRLQNALSAEGLVFRDLLRLMRARRAMQLMGETSDTLAQIALQVGYSDQAHFNRAFAAVAGMTPGEWRTRRLD